MENFSKIKYKNQKTVYYSNLEYSSSQRKKTNNKFIKIKFRIKWCVKWQ